MTPAPKFFCESCGAEVARNAKACPSCGKFFASVKCPACGFSGDTGIFRDGCPACGYAVPGAKPVPGSAGCVPPAARAGKKKADHTDPLPWWVYLVSLLFLLSLIAFILFQR